jgi:Dolichyl-phosphate-mannose-protein mannosyltransferase
LFKRSPIHWATFFYFTYLEAAPHQPFVKILSSLFELLPINSWEMKKMAYRLFVLVIGFFFLFYIGTRAYRLSMTHDESSTTNVVDGSYTGIMFAKNMFGTANNHILNSLLLKKSVSMFGWHEWSIRLPNVLSFLLYFAAVVLIMQRISKNNAVRLAGILLFCAPHFIIDYFSLARGYGMSVAFQTMSLYLLIRFFEERKQRHLALSFVMLALAVYANFTWLNILLAQWAVVNIVLMLEKKEQPFVKFATNILRFNLVPLLVTVVLVLLIYKPIGYLSGNNEFKWGSETWWASFHSFVVNLHYTHSSFIIGYDIRLLLLKLFVLALLVTGAILLVQHLFFNRWKQVEAFSKYSLFTAVLLLFVLTISTILQRYLLNTFYIDGRKALLYMPVLLLLAVALFNWVHTKYALLAKSLLSTTVLAAVLHFIGIFNFYSCFEWWYDASSKMAYQSIVNDKSDLPKTTAVNWLYWQSMEFYNKRVYKNTIPVLKKTNELADYNGINYAYVLGDEIRNVPPVFKPVKRYMWDRFLLKRDQQFYEVDLKTQILYQHSIDSTKQLPIEDLRKRADSVLLQQRKELNWSLLLLIE